MTVLENEVTPVRRNLSLWKCHEKDGQSIKRKCADEVAVPYKKPHVEEDDDMLNGYRSNEHRCENGAVAECPVATLSNTGNTCYLNSVLYTLRFAPTFLHNLHHLVDDLSKLSARLVQNKVKSSSLGRSVGSSISGPSSRSTSSKDLLSLGGLADVLPKSKVQLVTEKLHDVFRTMRNHEEVRKRESNEPFQPVEFLQAVREANYIFEGNQQQDAHELLVYLLDNIRETCDLLAQRAQNCPEPSVADGDVSTASNSRLRLSWKKPGKKKEKLPIKEEEDAYSTDVEDNGKKFCYNFVAEDFEGVTLRRTKCLECESVTERKEPFYDIPVPIQYTKNDANVDPSELYRRACVTTEKLCESNKYLCEQCIGYNEASREVKFEKLPNIMVLQLKRFTTTNVGVEKVNSYMPTPLRLACFCETCCRDGAAHRYELCCIIMHLGGALASGHYIAYVRAGDNMDDYTDCSRDTPKTGGLSSGGGSEKSLNIFKYFKPPKIEHKNGITPTHHCKSRGCCGIKMNKNLVENAINYARRGVGPSPDDEMWLECDDESVRPITGHELQDLLACKPESTSTSTPYLLFYSKINAGVDAD